MLIPVIDTVEESVLLAFELFIMAIILLMGVCGALFLAGYYLLMTVFCLNLDYFRESH